MKPLLWIVFVAAIAANIFFNLGVKQDGLHIALSVVCGVVVLASGARLWMLRDRADA
ncbi:hypothetical protein OH809_16555 [Streptomyces sp. NBC_00873]|uniref:hypothetical protein n=1 Tax=unclassified Streptomyces TaxID=2593676 RepID=UPI0038634544|nr:hypothetical protein OH809_16555 [Streptomyces sp. NBC_00873]WTA45843.1 hypothetical protein OH821_27130 [Streptomyces sp. NBC_00842]